MRTVAIAPLKPRQSLRPLARPASEPLIPKEAVPGAHS